MTQVAPKSPGLALLGSFFVPGLGQLMNGQVGKGLLLFIAYLVSIVLMFVVIGFFTAFAIWVWAMADAYGGAQRWNARHRVRAEARQACTHDAPRTGHRASSADASHPRTHHGPTPTADLLRLGFLHNTRAATPAATRGDST